VRPILSRRRLYWAALRGFRSLTGRLIAWTLLLTGSVYLASVAISNAVARRLAIEAAEREAVNEVDAAANQVEDLLHSLEERTLALADALSVLDPSPDTADRLLRAFVEGNRDLYGGAIAWATSSGAPPHALYYHWTTGSEPKLAKADLASPSYHYWTRDWFVTPMRSGEPGWTEPYVDEGGGGVEMVTYSVPFRGPQEAWLGVVTADVRLSRINGIVESIELGRRGFGLVLSRGGIVIAASGSDGRIQPNAPVLGQASAASRARLEPVVRQMLSGAHDFVPVQLEAGSFRVSYRPLGRAGWSLAALYPEDELLAGVRRLRALQALLALAGLALLALVVVVLSHRVTRPLTEFARSARVIAGGDLDAPLPEVASRDELGQLAASFHHMRDSLRDYVRDLAETTAAKERLLGELKVARRIQSDMLPPPVAGGPDQGFELGATLVPARAVGGDLFLHFRDRARVFVLVGDVSGKGIPAALFMARTKTVFEAAAERAHDPGAILEQVNHGLCRDNESGMFVTAAVGVLDLASGELALALAGHDPPVLVPAVGAPALVTVEGGRVLGLIDAPDFPVNRLRLAPGDAVVLFTDGVGEAQDAAGGFFGVDRIVSAMAGSRHEPAAAMTEGLLKAVRDFAGDAPQSDDITILTLRRHAPA
jgi:phosphoserine phosphatase RsbU/P